MKGRVWIGLLGGLGAFVVSMATAGQGTACVCGLIGLATTVIGGAVAGYLVTRMDEDVKAGLSGATNAGAVAGLIVGIGGAIGLVAGAFLWENTLSSNPQFREVWDETMLEPMVELYQEQGFDVTKEEVESLLSTLFLGGGFCLGLLGVALTTGAGALAARLSAPGAKPTPSTEAIPPPTWGATSEAAPQPPEPLEDEEEGQ